MWQKTLFVCCLIALSCSLGVSQRNVTNDDLKVYRDTRIRADREYRENYRRWGQPSPEELERRREESLRDTVDLSIQLRAQRLERERIDAGIQMQRESNEAMQQMVNQLTAPPPERYPNYTYYDNSIWGSSYYNPYYYGQRRVYGQRFPYYGRPYGYGQRSPYYGQPYGHFAGGQFFSGGLYTPKPQPNRGLNQPYPR